MANISKVNFNGNNLDVKDAYAREQILHKTADNYTADVTGDYTITAGDIAMSSANTTMHTTADRTIDTDGNDSVHIDGASTLNVSGLRTETFAGDKTETVTGTATERAGNRNTTITGKWAVNLPGKAFDMKDVALENNVTSEISTVVNELTYKIARAAYINIESLGCVGDGVTDNREKLQQIINENVGQTIFIPSGTFLISGTITLPSGTVIAGCGFNSIVKANTNSFDMFKTENFDSLTGTDTHNSAVGNWFLYNFMIDGNYYASAENETLTGRAAGRGLCIYGNNYYLVNMIISNNPDTGVWLENNTYDNPAFNLLRAGEWTIDNCVIKFNGQHGLYSHNVYDYHLINSTIASNSRKQHATYDNLRIDGGNVKCTTSHFYSNYGSIKPACSVHIMPGSGKSSFVNCHIEGAVTPLYIGSGWQTFANCVIYASFGTHDCTIAGSRVIMTSCIFINQTGDPIPEKPEWKSAINFLNNPRNCYIHAICENTPLIDDMTNCGYLNVFHIFGYNNTGLMNNTACKLDAGKADYVINGDFGEQSEYKELSSVHNYTSVGAPDAIQFDYFDTMTGDRDFRNNLCTITGYTSGTLNIYEWVAGRIRFIINKTTGRIPFRASGITVDGGTAGTIEPNSIMILISNTTNNYTSINVKQ